MRSVAFLFLLFYAIEKGVCRVVILLGSWLRSPWLRSPWLLSTRGCHEQRQGYRSHQSDYQPLRVHRSPFRALALVRRLVSVRYACRDREATTSSLLFCL